MSIRLPAAGALSMRRTGLRLPLSASLPSASGPTLPGAPIALKHHDPLDFTSWQIKLDAVRAGADNARYFIVGDSTAAGALAADFAGTYPSRLTKRLAEYIPAEQTWAFPHFPDNGPNTRDPRVSMTGAWGEYASASFWYHQDGGPEAWVYAPCDPTVGGPATVDTFEVWTWGGTFTALIDDVPTSTWTDPSVVTKHTVHCPSDDVHVLKLVGGPVLVAANAYSSNRTVVQVANRGVNGQTVSGFAPTSNDYDRGGFADLYRPDLTSLVLGINDFGAPGASAQGTADALGAIVAHAAAAGSKSLIHTQYPTDDTDRLALEAAFAAVIGATADAQSCAVLDIFNDWGGSHAAHPERFADMAHPNDAGYELSAETTVAALLNL